MTGPLDEALMRADEAAIRHDARHRYPSARHPARQTDGTCSPGRNDHVRTSPVVRSRRSIE
jgi:hypothetical protein